MNQHIFWYSFITKAPNFITQAPNIITLACNSMTAYSIFITDIHEFIPQYSTCCKSTLIFATKPFSISTHTCGKGAGITHDNAEVLGEYRSATAFMMPCTQHLQVRWHTFPRHCPRLRENAQQSMCLGYRCARCNDGSSGSLSSGSVSRLPAKRCTTSRVTAQDQWSPTAVPQCPTRVQRTRELLLSLPGYRIQIQCSGTALGACAFRCTAKQALSLLCIEAQSMRIRGCTHCSAAALPMLHHVIVIRVPVDRHLEYAAARECTHADLVLVVVRCHAAKSGHVRPSARLGRAVHHDGGSNLHNA